MVGPCLQCIKIDGNVSRASEGTAVSVYPTEMSFFLLPIKKTRTEMRGVRTSFLQARDEVATVHVTRCALWYFQ
jgi:hypothetical protein